MNFGRIAAAAVVAWIVSLPVGFFVNEVLLADIVAPNASAMRPEAELMANLPLGFAFLLLGFFAFAYVYAKGYEGGSGVQEGIRFGALLGVLSLGYGSLVNFAVLNIGGGLTAAMAAAGFVEWIVMGIVIGLVYQPAGSARSR